MRGDGRLKPGAQFLNPWSKVILESIVEDLEVQEVAGGSASVSFRIRRGEEG